jgi:glycosyltransferase involved in cell wall biosynthesis
MAGGATAAAQLMHAHLGDRHDTMYWPGDGLGANPVPALADFRPDIVHVHCFATALRYRVLSSIARAYPVVYTLHDPLPVSAGTLACWSCSVTSLCIGCPTPPQSHYVRSRIGKLWTHLRCDLHCVVPSQWMRRRVAATEIAWVPTSHIPYGVDTERFRPGRRSPRRFGLPARVRTLVFVGSNYGADNPRKGLHTLRQAFAEVVRPAFPGARLVVVGREAALPQPGVVYLGEVASADMPSVLQAADVYVLPTLADNLPLSVLEAMASGLATVGAAVGGVPEQIEHGEHGLLVPPADPRALGQALVQLLGDGAQRRRLGRAARARAVRCFDVRRYVADHERLYARIVSARTLAPHR